MDSTFLAKDTSFEPFSSFNQKLSFSNSDFNIYKDPSDLNFSKYEELEDLFKKEENRLSFNLTIDNSKELKQIEDHFKKKEEKINVDKKYIETIQLKVKENIYSKRPFKEKKILGRKKKAYEGLGEHNKFSNDNIIRKVKHVILHNIMQFINEKIKNIFAYEDKKILKEKKIFKLKQNQLISSKTDYNKDFLEKTLGVIFSGDISTKYSCYPSTHNKTLIESLINDKDDKNRNIFKNIFNLTFVDCLNHFRGSKIVEELEGMNNLEDFLKDLKKANDEEYCSLFKYFVINFETIIKEKKSRIRTKK